MNKQTWYEGLKSAQMDYDRIISRGQKWRNRNIPIYIRENLMVPYYITQDGEKAILHGIRYPSSEFEKVHFMVVAQINIDESTAIFIVTKPGGEGY
ncbi:hypothetical protein HNQ92_001476 [Rhabdobacter roseus]|uniref:Uncharacterized protein n=1 Tax=Rhabdobacter roseus TaxID=1655419 RepID=A0A840TTM8_9BACT|nr:hypothetical protein [Rhabdobacter roseus]MBB5283350.1 hypothetical protein [Rhabdobacter roseus]